ncbi:hypothetical protein PAL_GLEAN10012182 [Pteropus alecto]|uniref:Uncharacterized protein n=1 Tax=Pteropus alecto TaxID=9402 RepID=L5KBM7_PTEAL|nr:hypothetical protein PAL_GLEAN10012182 [Pteropus alecto]
MQYPELEAASLRPQGCKPHGENGGPGSWKRPLDGYTPALTCHLRPELPLRPFWKLLQSTFRYVQPDGILTDRKNSEDPVRAV